MKSLKSIIPAIIILAVLLCGCSSTYSSYEKPHTQRADTVFASSETTQEPSITQQPEIVELPPQLEIAIEDIYQANRRENLLNNDLVFHVSVLLADHTQQIDLYYTQGAYFEEQTQYWKSATTKQLILYTESETCQMTVFNGGEEEFSIVGFFMPIEDNNRIRGSLDDYHPVRKIMLREMITSALDSGDCIEVETEIPLESPEDCQALRLQSDKVGCICRYVYRLDRDPLMILERQEYLRYPDGNEELYSVYTAEYLLELPEIQSEMLSKLNGQGQNEERRTISVVYDPDTPQQRSFSVTVDSTTLVHYVFLPEYELFCDKNGLEPLTQIPQEGNVIIYSSPEKQAENVYV